MSKPLLTPRIEHLVSAQREGMTLVSGWRVQAQVTAVSGRKFAPVTIALCSEKSDAEEIASLLSERYYGGLDSNGSISFTYWGVVYRPKDTDHSWSDWGDWSDESVARREVERCREELPTMEVALRKVVKVVEYLDA